MVIGDFSGEQMDTMPIAMLESPASLALSALSGSTHVQPAAPNEPVEVPTVDMTDMDVQTAKIKSKNKTEKSLLKLSKRPGKATAFIWTDGHFMQGTLTPEGKLAMQSRKW